MSYSNASTGGKPADPYKEENIDEPSLKAKIEGLLGFIKSSKFGMLTTRDKSTGLLASRCMAVTAQEGGGVDLLFYTNTESGKTDDIESDPHVNVSFLNSTGEWASVSGQAIIITDRAVVRKYYFSGLKGWVGDLGDGIHNGGAEDPRIGVIKVITKTATYAIATGTVVGRGIEIAKGAVTGEPPNVTKLRQISEGEFDEWRKIST